MPIGAPRCPSDSLSTGDSADGLPAMYSSVVRRENTVSMSSRDVSPADGLPLPRLSSRRR